MSLPLGNNIESVVHRIHSAAGEAGGWHAAMSGVRQLLHGRAAMLGKHDFGSGKGQWLFESPMVSEAHETHHGNEPVLNPWFLSSLDYQAGRIMTGEEVLAGSALARTDFYRRYLRRRNLYHRLCGVIERRGDVVYYVDVLRGRDEPAFSGSDKGLFGPVLGHIKLSFRNYRQLLSARSTSTALRSLVDGLSSAVFVVDARASILLHNTSASAMLEADGVLTTDGCRLLLRSRTEHRALLEMVREVTDSDSVESAATPRVVRILGSAGYEPLIITVRAAGAVPYDEGGQSCQAAILIVKRTGSENHCARCAFLRLYDFTPAQSRLVGLVVSGHSLTAAARCLGVSDNTARSHLKQIYLKTGTHGQVELVHLHASICSEFM